MGPLAQSLASNKGIIPGNSLASGVGLSWLFSQNDFLGPEVRVIVLMTMHLVFVFSFENVKSANHHA